MFLLGYHFKDFRLTILLRMNARFKIVRANPKIVKEVVKPPER